jgi:hypothetical protein
LRLTTLSVPPAPSLTRGAAQWRQGRARARGLLRYGSAPSGDAAAFCVRLLASGRKGVQHPRLRAATAPCGAVEQKGWPEDAGRAGVTPEMAMRLEKALGSTADTWLRMQMNYDLAGVRARASLFKVKRLTPA